MAKPPVLRSAPRAVATSVPLSAFLDVAEGNLLRVPLTCLVPWNEQPRRKIHDFTIEELAESIKQKGVLQPILVRPFLERANTWQIIAGERRWRAAERAGVQEVPILVRSMSDADALIVALIENLQREDLNIMDRARALRRLYEHLGSWTAVGKAVGFGEESMGGKALTERRMFQLNALNELPEPVQEAIHRGELTEKHGRAIGRLKDSAQQDAFFKTVSIHQLSGPESETLLRLIQQESTEDLDYARHLPRVRSPQKADPQATALVSQIVRAGEELSRLFEQVRRAGSNPQQDESIDRVLKKVEASGRAWRRARNVKTPISALPPGI